MHLEQHAVEEEAVGRRPAGGVTGQAAEDELLGAWREEAPQCEQRRAQTSPDPKGAIPKKPAYGNVHRERRPVSSQVRTSSYKQDSRALGPGLPTLRNPGAGGSAWSSPIHRWSLHGSWPWGWAKCQQIAQAPRGHVPSRNPPTTACPSSGCLSAGPLWR